MFIIKTEKKGFSSLKKIPLLPLLNGFKLGYFGHMPYLKDLGKADNDNTIITTIYKRKLRFYEECNSKVFRLIFPQTDILFCRDPEFNKEILGAKHKSFSNSKNFKKSFGYFFPNAVIVVEGEKWHQLRKIVQISLNNTPIDMIIPTICSIVDKHMDPEVTNNSFTYDVISQITFDTFNSVMYGWDPKAVSGGADSNFILKNCEIISHAIGSRVLSLSPYLWKIPTFENLRIKLASKHLRNFTTRFIANKSAFVGSKAEGQRSSLVEELLNAASQDETKLTSDEIYDQVAGIFFAAFDTTTNTLRYMLYYLAKYPDYQEQLRKETYEKFPNGLDDIKIASSSTIDSLTSLSNFVDEVNRLNPLVPFIGRYCLEDVEINGYELKKDWVVLIDSQSVGQDAQYWKGQTDLACFRPDRWNEHRPSILNSVLPFGFGARVCPGRRIALLEIKALISAILTKYKITLRNPYDKLDLESSVGVTIKKKVCNVNIEILQ